VKDIIERNQLRPLVAAALYQIKARALPSGKVATTASKASAVMVMRIIDRSQPPTRRHKLWRSAAAPNWL
jgi:hypothetical protein